MVIVLVSLIAYFQTLRLGYVSDDLPSLKHTYKKGERWYRINRATGNKQRDHLVNLLIHTAVCVSIYLALGQNTISFIAALLFCVNPVNNQGAIWISGRHYALGALGLMLAMVIPYLAPLLIFGATINPATFFVVIGYLGSDKYWLVLCLPLIWLIRWKPLTAEIGRRRRDEATAFDKSFDWRKLITSVKLYGYYFTLCLIPFRLTWYHSFMQSGAGAGNVIMRQKAFKLDWTFWVGLGVGGYLVYSFWNWTPVSWGVFWFSVCILPYLNLYRMQQEVAERYCYLANIGIMFALAHFASPVVFAVFFTMFLTRLLTYYPRAYKDDYWLVEAAVYEDSGAWFAWLTRGHKRWDTQSYREAIIMWVMARLISPQEFKVLFNIAVALKLLKQDEESEHYLKLAEKYIIKGQEELSRGWIKMFREGKFPLLK